MLTKAIKVTSIPSHSLFARSLALRGFAAKEYDLAVIGGGPGGKLKLSRQIHEVL
jgi:hypothetical protein